MSNTEYDHDKLKWGKVIGPADCALRGLDPHSFVPHDLNHPDWKLPRNESTPSPAAITPSSLSKPSPR